MAEHPFDAVSRTSPRLQVASDRVGVVGLVGEKSIGWLLSRSISVSYALQSALRLATFNARIETVTTKPFFREPFKKKRCLMPVSGYYEWEDTPGGKQPHYFTARDGSPVMTIAGLWDEWKNRESGERIKSCTMIISEPNSFVAEVHDRMPVLLQPDQFDHWLSGTMTIEELKSAPNDYLQRWTVSKRVNSSKADKEDATLIEPVKLAA